MCVMSVLALSHGLRFPEFPESTTTLRHDQLRSGLHYPSHTAATMFMLRDVTLPLLFSCREFHALLRNGSALKPLDRFLTKVHGSVNQRPTSQSTAEHVFGVSNLFTHLTLLLSKPCVRLCSVVSLILNTVLFPRPC